MATSVVPGDRVVEARGLRIHYLDWQGKGPPVVLLHSAYSTAHVWDFFAPTITDVFHVVAPDLRGYGKTDRTPLGYSARELAEDLTAFADALGLRRFHLVGHSIGTRIGARLAARYSERLLSLVLVDCTGFRASAQQETQRRYIAELQLSFASAEEAAPYLRTRHKRNYWDDEVIAHRIAWEMDHFPDGSVAWQYPREVLYQVNEAHSDDDVIPVAPSILCPTLVLRGGDSPNLTREEAQQLAAMIPHSTLVEIPHAAHYLHLDQRAEFARVTRAFLLRFCQGG